MRILFGLVSTIHKLMEPRFNNFTFVTMLMDVCRVSVKVMIKSCEYGTWDMSSVELHRVPMEVIGLSALVMLMLHPLKGLLGSVDHTPLHLAHSGACTTL